jgi:hypothetical protein
MHEDEHVTVVSDGGGGGVSAGLIAGILIVILIIAIIWWFGFGPGVANNNPGTNINVNLPSAVPSP